MLFELDRFKDIRKVILFQTTSPEKKLASPGMDKLKMGNETMVNSCEAGFRCAGIPDTTLALPAILS